MELIAGGNLTLNHADLELTIQAQVPTGIELDCTAYLLDEQTQKVRGDHDMVFYGQTQTPNGSVILKSNNQFKINTQLIDPAIKKIVICASLSEPHTFNILPAFKLQLSSQNQHVAQATVQTQARSEKALILAEVYRHNGAWKFRFIDQGFNGGLQPLAEHFGVEIDSTPKPPPLNLSKINLSKTNAKINLSKKGQSFGKIAVNLNWNKGTSKQKTFFQKLTRSDSIDLDLGAMIEFQDGSIDLVQALGKSFGNLNSKPYILLDQDDRTGSSLSGENLQINGDYWEKIKRVLIYTYIYEGVAKWTETDAKVTIRLPQQPEIEVALTDGNHLTCCGIVQLQNIKGEIQATREVHYFKDQEQLDKFYQFGFRWRKGTKD